MVITPSASIVLNTIDANKVVGAGFEWEGVNRLRIVNETGLIEYGIASGKIAILDTTINSTWVKKAIFSPDGQWVGLINMQTDGNENLYVVSTHISTR